MILISGRVLSVNTVLTKSSRLLSVAHIEHEPGRFLDIVSDMGPDSFPVGSEVSVSVRLSVRMSNGTPSLSIWGIAVVSANTPTNHTNTNKQSREVQHA